MIVFQKKLINSCSIKNKILILSNVIWTFLIGSFIELYISLQFSSFTVFSEIFFSFCTGCPKKHGNSVTNSMSSLLWISSVIPNVKSHNIIMSARVYFMKSVKDCKDVSIMSSQDEQWRRTSLLCLYKAIFLFYYSTAVCSQNINKMWS